MREGRVGALDWPSTMSSGQNLGGVELVSDSRFLLSSYVASDMMAMQMVGLNNHVINFVLLDLFYGKKFLFHN
jgi:hypothetical protein